jgi:hypothetical protein
LGESWSTPRNFIDLTYTDTLNVLDINTPILQYTVDGLTEVEVRMSRKFGPTALFIEDYGFTQVDLIGCFLSDTVYGDTITGVLTTETLNSFYLAQNFPNPFNSYTIFQYYLPELMRFELSLYNILGEQVKILFSGTQNAGLHQIEFDAGSLASGLYLYKFDSGKYRKVKSCLLIK